MAERAIAYNGLVPVIDTVPTTTHYVVFDDHGAAMGYLRAFPHKDARKIGRAVTAGSVRGTGLGKLLMDALVAEESGPLVMSGQAYLEDYYARWGFVCVGEP